MFSSCFEAVNEVNGGNNDVPDLIQRENAIQSQETNSEVVNIPNDSAYASFVNISTPLRNFSNVMRKQLSPRIKNVLVKKKLITTKSKFPPLPSNDQSNLQRAGMDNETKTLCPVESLLLVFHHMNLKTNLVGMGFCNNLTEVLHNYLPNLIIHLG